MVQSVTLGFIQSAFVGKSEDTKQTINKIIFLTEKWCYLCEYQRLCVI